MRKYGSGKGRDALSLAKFSNLRPCLLTAIACFTLLAMPLGTPSAMAQNEADEQPELKDNNEPEVKVDPLAPKDDEKPLTDYELMKVFVDTFHQVEKNYVKDVDRRVLVEAAVRGMLTELDPYSNYISPEDLQKFDEEVNQEFGGVGIQVEYDKTASAIVVISPMPGTPAYKAGMHAGDRITQIDGKKVAEFEVGNELENAVRLMRGKPGEEVEIVYTPVGTTDSKTVKIAREIINVATIMGDHYNADDSWNYFVDEENKIGYIRLTHFTQKTTQELREALKVLKQQQMKALILDLRFNPGGLLSTATEVSDLFIESGKIVSTKGRNTRERVWHAVKPGTYSGFPMAILVNRFSASASEIVSACLQDHDRAVVIGERTWGKGSVQNVIEMEEGASALKLTTASYHRPSGKNIHRFPNATEKDEWGVMPNDGFVVPFTSEQIRGYLEYRRTRDILSKNGPPKSDFVDTQLNKAVDYLRDQLDVKKKDDEKAEQPAQGKTKPKKAALAPIQLNEFSKVFSVG